ncbi:MAG: hypothetical protein KF832_20925 [Caldilineaceae bacterium]|nr:hypothetical protein [Caldilineaceae bacterium]
MESTISELLAPMTGALPTFSAWAGAGDMLKQQRAIMPQSLWQEVEHALRVRREVTVAKVEQVAKVPQAIVALQQSNTGLFAHEVVIVKQRARQVLTVLRTLDEGVQLCSWRVNADGTILRTGSSNAPFAQVRQVQAVHARNYVLACRTATGELQLSRWEVSNTGAIYLAGIQTNCAQQVQWVELVALTVDRVATVVQTTTGTWQLMIWQLQGDDSIQRLACQSLDAALVNSCALTVLPASEDGLRLALLTTETPTTLALHLWHYQATTGLRLLTTQRLGLPVLASITVAQVDEMTLRVLVQTVTGQLQLLTWAWDQADQTLLYRDAVALGEEVGQVACQPASDGFMLVSRTLRNVVQLQAWQATADGQFGVVGRGHQPVAALSTITICDDRLEGNAPFLSGLVDAEGELTLTTWGWA